MSEFDLSDREYFSDPYGPIEDPLDSLLTADIGGEMEEDAEQEELEETGELEEEDDDDVR